MTSYTLPFVEIPASEFVQVVPRTTAATKNKLRQTSLVALAIFFAVVVLVLPVLAVFMAALRHGLPAFLTALSAEETIAALKLSLTVIAIVVPLNTCFGVALAWAITKCDSRAKTWLLAFTDLPLAVSPVVGGLMLVLLYGSRSWLGSGFAAAGIPVIFATPAIVLASLFVTAPYIARQIFPLMQSQGRASEEAAIMLGASGSKTFWRITFPSIRWALMQGMILCAARTLGEFGAVSVVSGHIRGQTTTLPLQVEMLYNEYQFTSAYSVAALMSLFAVITLVLRALLDRDLKTQQGGF